MAGLNALADRLIPSEVARQWLGWIIPLGALLFAVTVYPYSSPGGVILNGGIVGGRIALIALGIALVYRANRVINFAAAELGLVPTVFAVLLVITAGWSYLLGAAAGLVAAVFVGFVVQTLIVRRFSESPRLILTVATIGISQLLIGVSLFLPDWLDNLTGASFERFGSTQLVPPITVSFEFGGTTFNGNDLITLIVIPVCFVALAWFLTRSSTGMAVRAAAERSDRAAMLGIPVKRIHTIVWIVASVLAFVSLYLRAGSVGLPLGKVLGPTFLLQAIAAVVIGRFESFPRIAFASIGIGILDQANTFQQGNRPAFNDVMLFIIVVGALLLTRASTVNRAGDVSTWKATGDVRPVPAELAHLPEVRFVRWVGGLVLAAFVLLIPLWLTEAQRNLATVIIIFGVVAVSLVVLTGWAGQVSLGQVAFVGIGGAVGGALTANEGWDISLAMLAGGVVGAVVTVIVGYPAIRRRGLTLAVVTYGFALVVSTYFVNREFFGDWLPPSRIERPDLFGFIDIASETRFYYFSLATLALVILLIRGIRNSRTGRALIAIRENENAARSYGINAVRTTMAGFAISGFFAALAGVLFVHHQNGLGTAVYAPEESLTTFSAVVIGGMSSIPGALLGSVYVRGAKYFLPGNWTFFASSFGLLIVLWVLPRGLGGSLALVRDAYLRKVAKRRGLVVPSLLADRRVEEPEAQVPTVVDDAVPDAAAAIEETV